MDLHKKLRDDYSNILKNPDNSIINNKNSFAEVSSSVGYSEEDLSKIPEESNLGLGCGNPVKTADLKTGEIVVDLGSGAGLDCFLSGTIVGRRGRVIGVDMTPEMLSTARSIAKKYRIRNVEFRLGEIENLPVADNYADVCISNCVINLSDNKRRVYQEILRILKPGGRISISDIVIMKELPDNIADNRDMHSC